MSTSITEVTQMKPGEYFKVRSPAGGIRQAPFTKQVGGFTGDGHVLSSHDDDRGITYPLDMANYLGTVSVFSSDIGSYTTVHEFSQ